jgi:Putative binding domain, N-terminal
MQAGGCAYTLTPPTSQTVPQAGGNFTVAVATTTGCTWTAAVNGSPNWIRITSGGNGSGNGTVAYTVDQRTSGGPRSATLTIAGRTFTVNQN